MSEVNQESENTSYQTNRDFILSLKFKFSHFEKHLNYEMYTKGKDWKMIVFYGRDEGHFFDIPRFWLIKGIYTKFDGDIHNKEELELIMKLVHV